jgi:predicted Rossmann-fold nucleotide-binding protein
MMAVTDAAASWSLHEKKALDGEGWWCGHHDTLCLLHCLCCVAFVAEGVRQVARWCNRHGVSMLQQVGRPGLMKQSCIGAMAAAAAAAAAAANLLLAGDH